MDNLSAKVVVKTILFKQRKDEQVVLTLFPELRDGATFTRPAGLLIAM